MSTTVECQGASVPSRMQHVMLGVEPGISVSRIALGTAMFGISPRDGDVHELVRAAVDLGVNLFDTADSYGNQPDYDRPGLPAWTQRPSAEELLGAALRGVGQGVLVASKVGEPLGEARLTEPFEGHLTRAHILRQAAISLKRLGRDRIDLYYAHRPDPHTPLEETVSAFDELIRRGDVGEWGLSNYSGEETEAVVSTAERLGLRAPVVNQVPYSLADRRVESDLVPVAIRRDVKLVAYSPLGTGLLAGRTAAQRDWVGPARWGGERFSEAALDRAAAYEEFVASFGQSPVSVALAWLLQRPSVAGVVVGSSSPEHLRAACQAVDVSLGDEQVAGLEALRFP